MARRIVKDPAHRHLRDEFKLKGWIGKVDGKRQVYFEGCEKALELLGTVCGEEEPDDDAVVEMIAAMLQEDDTFTAHVGKKNGSSWLKDSENWVTIREVGARQIYHEYLVDKEGSDG